MTSPPSCCARCGSAATTRTAAPGWRSRSGSRSGSPARRTGTRSWPRPRTRRSPPSPTPAGWPSTPSPTCRLGLHVRRTVRGVPASMWLDGLVGVLAVAAVGIAVVVAPIVAGAGGTHRGAGRQRRVPDRRRPPASRLVIAFLCLGGRWPRPRLDAARRWASRLFAAADSAYLLMLAERRHRVEPAARRRSGSSGISDDRARRLAAAGDPRASARPTGGSSRCRSPPARPRSALLLYAGLGARAADRGLPRRRGARDRAMVRTTASVYELRRLARDPPPGEHRRADRAAEPPLVRPRAAPRDRPRARRGRAARAARDRPRPLQGAQRHARPPRRRPRARPARPADPDRAARGRPRRPPRRRRVRRAAARRRRRRRRPASGSPRPSSERFTVEGIELQIAASIGIALFPEHGHDAETLLQRADVAMYQAKTRRSGTEFYARERDLPHPRAPAADRRAARRRRQRPA